MSVQRWHSAYRDIVLMPDYRFAVQHLSNYFLDAMSAHVRTVKRLEDPQVQAHQAAIGKLEAGLEALRDQALPSYDPEVPDLYFAFNKRLEETVGQEAVSFLRIGLSRNDLDMTVYKMRSRELLLLLIDQTLTLRKAILALAERHFDTVLIAHTHHQPGQPTTVAHYLAAIDNVLARDFERLMGGYKRLNTCPLGAAAFAGSSYPLDRVHTSSLLGFDAPVDNTYDAVASSDWQVEFVTSVQSCALTLSRFVCDLIHWAQHGVFRLSDSLVQGSSIMPQKRNPVALEHARTRFSRALGSSQMVLYSSHNIPYADLNDFGPDIQGALVSLSIQLGGGLSLLTASMVEGEFDLEKLAEVTASTDTTATELADELTRQAGLSFQEAHRLAAALTARMREQGKRLQEARSEDLRALGGPEVSADLLGEALDPVQFVARRKGLGGPAPEAMRDHVKRAKRRLDENFDTLEQVQSKLNEARARLRAS